MSFIDEYLRLVRGTHEQIRRLVADLDPHALNWTPGPATNSVAVLVTHMLASEAEVLVMSAGGSSDRDRASEFAVRADDAKGLLSLVDLADAVLDANAPALTDERLAASWLRPSAQRNKTEQTSLFWLMNNYGHMREHIAHLELTLQLYRQRI